MGKTFSLSHTVVAYKIKNKKFVERSKKCTIYLDDYNIFYYTVTYKTHDAIFNDCSSNIYHITLQKCIKRIYAAVSHRSRTLFVHFEDLQLLSTGQNTVLDKSL